MEVLQNESVLQGGRYMIKRALGQGGFGITYLAVQSGLERKVAVKEFFMKELCERDENTSHVTLGTKGSKETVNRFREKFLKEARNLARLNHPHIVRIIDVFEENGTAYYVMEYAENGSLADKVKREGRLTEPVATRYILQVAEALSYIHQQKMNHLDVKPGNIMLNEKDESVLIDFGLSKQYDAVTGSQTSTTPVGISEGYAPMEQYKQGGVGEFSPETDIYALGATFFKLLTGKTPPSASDVNEDGVPTSELRANGVSDKAIAVICKAMESRKKDRTSSAQTFIDWLRGGSLPKTEDTKVEPVVSVVDERTVVEVKPQPKPVVKPRPQPQPSPRPTPKSAPKPSKTKWYVLAGALAAVLVLGVILLGRKGAEQQTATTSTANGHEWVDLGLPSGTKWATMNVGASSPSDYGNYYAWGETSTKSSYTWKNLKYRTSGDSDDNFKFSKYVTNSDYGSADGKEELDPSDDAAYVNWGSGWRMPSKEQIQELQEKCKWTWTSQGGHKGYKVVGPNGNSLFLPAAGCRNGGSSDFVGSYGHYWSRTLGTSYGSGAYVLFFNSDFVGRESFYRCYGQSVRPVLAP